MKFVVALFAFCVMCLNAASPVGSWQWYTPAGGYKNKGFYGTWKDGKNSYEVEIDENGEVKWGDNVPSSSSVQFAIETAMHALNESEFNKEEIRAISDNLESLLVMQGIKVSTKNGGSYTLKLAGGSLRNALSSSGGGPVSAGNIDGDSDMPEMLFSPRAFEMSGKYLTLANINNTVSGASIGSMLSQNTTTKKIPCLDVGVDTAANNLHWYEIGQLNPSNNVDNITIENHNGKLQISGADSLNGYPGLFIPYYDSGSFAWSDFEQMFDDELFSYDQNDFITLIGSWSAYAGTLFGYDMNGDAGFNEIGSYLDIEGNDGKFLTTDGVNVFWDDVIKSARVNDVDIEPDEDGVLDLGYVAGSIQINNEIFDPDDTGLVDIGKVARGVNKNGSVIEAGDDGTVNLGSVVTAVAINGNTVSPNGDGLVDLGIISSGAGGGAPGDNQSIQLNVNSAGVTNYSIKGWSEATTCNENMYDLLTDKQNSDRNTHEILCRVGGASGNMHFTKIGDAIPTPDSSHFEIGHTDGKFKIKAGSSGKFLKSDGTDVTWGSAVASIESSDTSQLEVSAPDENGKITLTPKSLGGGVTVTGTSGSASGGNIRFESMPDSNVKIEVSKNGDDIVVKIGVYYK